MRNIIVTDFLDQAALKYKDKIAYSDEKRDISFYDLKDEAVHVASKLIEMSLFKKPVIVYLEKSVECICAFFGAAYSGNFYTPIDVAMPENRIKKIMETLKPKAIITDGEHKDNASLFAGDVPIILYDQISSCDFDMRSITSTTEKIIDTDILYVLFTSGSTGVPKGVSIPHRAVIDYIDWFVDKFNITSTDVFGNQAPLHFDLSIQDVYAPIASGCTVKLMPRRVFSFPGELMKYLIDNDVNVIMWVPSALCAVANLKGLNSGKLPALRLVLFCGEVMPNKQLNMWRKAFPNAVFVNLYGPSEACDASTYYIVDREFADNESLPIGKPCRNTDVIVLNDQDIPVKANEVGELCLRGSSLSLGYYNALDKTDVAFVRNPVNSEYPEIIYRTGDLVQYNNFGELMYVGRKDFQIKHMGHRIELGEIEAAVSTIAGVDQNCCIYDMKRNRIVLFYSGMAESGEIKEKLKELVPEYMLPGKRIHLEEMPHNLNGKIDRAKLKEEI